MLQQSFAKLKRRKRPEAESKISKTELTEAGTSIPTSSAGLGEGSFIKLQCNSFVSKNANSKDSNNQKQGIKFVGFCPGNGTLESAGNGL